jgi:putative tryptophan/tyrosine transport system substrate-binding protein
MMDRRTFIEAVACSLLVAPLLARAQQTGKARRIGILTAGTIGRDWAVFFETLRELGWIEGQNIVIERRAAGGKAELVPGLAAELVQLRLDVIVTGGAVASLAAKSATTTIPIVTITGDPVRLGLVASMSRPGGNITGSSTVAPELAAKRLELLRELRPKATRLVELVDPANLYIKLIRKEDEQAYRSLGMQPIFVDVADGAQLERIFAEVARLKADALIVRGDPLFSSNRNEIASLALKHALPTMAEGSLFVSAGCLASYAPKASAMARGTAAFVDKILKGAKPGDLPIEQPTKFELAINLKTAKALGITIPQSLLLRADEVIQ